MHGSGEETLHILWIPRPPGGVSGRGGEMKNGGGALSLDDLAVT